MTSQGTNLRFGLGDRVLTACRDARPGGRPVPDAPQIPPQQAFSNAADALGAVLVGLDEAAWRTPAVRDLDVQGLIGHLIGVEYDVHRCLAADSQAAETEHVASTQPIALAQAGRPTAETYREWRDAVDQTLMLTAGADLDAPTALHRTVVPLGTRLVARAFELWSHENDIRRAVGLPPSRPEWSTLTSMTALAVGLLPVAYAQAGRHEVVNVHLVLTGGGGGTWDLDLAPADGSDTPDDPATTLIAADAVDFCRLAANRLAPQDIDAYIDGDHELAEQVLAAATTLALD